MKMDTKFYGDIFKAKDDSKVPEDQWVLFLVKDNAFAATLPTYLENCIKLGCDAEQIELVKKLIQRVNTWRSLAENQHLLKNPDGHGEKILHEEG